MKDNRMEQDVWLIKETDPRSQNYGHIFRFDFSYIEPQEIKDICKRCISGSHKAHRNTLSKLYTDLMNLKYFSRFATEYGIRQLRELDTEKVRDFITFLRNTKSFQYKKPLSYRYQKKLLDGLKSIISWCRVYEPEAVPDKEIFTGNEYTGTNDRLEIDYIPDGVVKQINQALLSEKNPCLKYGIIIMEYTGMRQGDLLRLGIDCIVPHPVNGNMIQWYNHKAGRQHGPIPVAAECAEAVWKLEQETRELREAAQEDLKGYLFLHICGKKGSNYGKIQKATSFSLKGWLNRFTEEHDIRDTDGNRYHLTPHQFRRTLGTDMLSKGIGINAIQEVLGHSSAAVTKRFYSDVKDMERGKVFQKIGMIGDIRELGMEHFSTAAELEWFQLNREKSACLCDGYCTRPEEEGKICERLLKRQKCYTCSRYITTPEYLDVHRIHLAALEKQTEAGQIYGEHYTSHFLPVIEVLKGIIQELEGMGNGKKS